MEVYNNICEFIRYSGLDKSFVGLDEKEVAYLINSKETIDIDFPETLIKIYVPDAKENKKSKITSLIESSKKKLILIKSSWAFTSKNALLLTYDVFISNLAPVFESMNAYVVKEPEEFFSFHRIKKITLPKIRKVDPMAIWLLASTGDVIVYTLYTNNGPYICARIVIDKTLDDNDEDEDEGDN